MDGIVLQEVFTTILHSLLQAICAYITYVHPIFKLGKAKTLHITTYIFRLTFYHIPFSELCLLLSIRLKTVSWGYFQGQIQPSVVHPPTIQVVLSKFLLLSYYQLYIITHYLPNHKIYTCLYLVPAAAVTYYILLASYIPHFISFYNIYYILHCILLAK